MKQGEQRVLALSREELVKVVGRYLIDRGDLGDGNYDIELVIQKSSDVIDVIVDCNRAGKKK